MRHEQVIGPTADDLRPIKGRGGGVPIWPDLARVVVEEADVARYVCAVLSKWAYSDAKTVATIAARLGLERCRVRFFEISNNATFIRSTGYLIQSFDGSVAFLVYRGTDPFDPSTWAVSADVNPVMVTSPRLTPLAPPRREPALVQQPPQPRGFDPVGFLVSAPAAVADQAIRQAGYVAETIGNTIGNVVGTVAANAGIAGAAALDLGRATQTLLAFSLILEKIAADAKIPGRDPRPEVQRRETLLPQVHAGFYRNQRATWFDFTKALNQALGQQSIFQPGMRTESLHWTNGKRARDEPPANPLRHLFVTGHSLGAAMALIAAYKIASECAYEAMNGALHHVYAFAPPRVGNAAFRDHFNHFLEAKTSCFAYKKDVIPHLPPEFEQTIDFEHVGNFYLVPEDETSPSQECAWPEDAGDPPRRADSPGQLLLSLDATFGDQLNLGRAVLSILRRDSVENFVRTFFRGLFEQRRYTLYDHSPEHYENVSRLAGLKDRTELGSDF